MPSIKVILRALGLLVDTGQWLEEGRVLACAYPRRERAFSALRMHGVSMLVNLHERAHDGRLPRHNLADALDRGLSAAVMRQQLGGGAEHREWIAKLVRESREAFVARFIDANSG